MNMTKVRIIMSICLALIISMAEAQSIDSSKSKVAFAIGNMKFKTVEGTFTGMSGNLKFNTSEISQASFDVCIMANTVNTNNAKRDDHLRNEDFFDVEKYPSICFNSTSVQKTTKGYLTKGKLTMHGVSKEIEIPFSIKGNSLEGQFSISRYDYNVGTDTGTFMVSEDVEITITCVLK